MTIQLKNIQFEQNKSELLESSFPELDKLARLMRQNPTMEIALGGHTDNLGSPKHSKELSENRVNAVKDYLISKGISKRRITGHGFGGSKPIADNTDPEERKLNRRVEVTFTKL